MPDTQIEALASRLVGRDDSLWPTGNVSQSRLGWLDVPRLMLNDAVALAAWAAGVDQSTVIVLGMGGSSLGPAVLAAVRDPSRAGRRLVVCDTTDPSTVAGIDFEDAFILVSSKSGTTLEPNVLFDYAWSRVPDGSRYAAITDPGTPLADLAREKGFDRVFVNPPDIGGRYSVLSYFGIVPAVLMGYDAAALCERALGADLAEAVDLGWEMGNAARAGRDKVTIVVSDEFASFGLWVEQLIAESTGKLGTGCVPVPTTQPESGPDRHVITLEPRTAEDLAELFYRFELAIPIAGHILGIDPFDEPNVAESKANTNSVLASLPLPDLPESRSTEVLEWLRGVVSPGDYVSLQAYFPFGNDAALEALRRRVRDDLGGIAVTAGYGPRFLHSTGQLHKGGPASVVVVQLVPKSPPPTVEIPGKPYDFATLIAAQSIGDYQSLVAHDRRVLRVAVDGLDDLE
jgi:transaldolase / glucose-6-phosphate isomerase